MVAMDLTVQVLGLPSTVTLQELNIFFSYCGTVEKIKLQRNKDISQMAVVTFTQPYGFQTALLLNDATFAGQSIRILPAKDISNSPIPDMLTNDTKNIKITQGIVPAMHGEMQAIASKGAELLNRTKEELEEKYKLSERSRLLMEQARSLVWAAEETAHHYIFGTANWLSHELDKASKRATVLGTGSSRKRDNPNSRKEK